MEDFVVSLTEKQLRAFAAQANIKHWRVALVHELRRDLIMNEWAISYWEEHHEEAEV